MEEIELTKEEKEAINYNKFKKRVTRLTPYVHTKRMFSRMEAQLAKEELQRKQEEKERRKQKQKNKK